MRSTDESQWIDLNNLTTFCKAEQSETLIFNDLKLTIENGCL